MEKTLLKCERKEGEYKDEYVVVIPLSNGKVHSGIVEGEDFDERGLLKVVVLEDLGKEVNILLPKRIGEKDTLRVKSEILLIS